MKTYNDFCNDSGLPEGFAKESNKSSEGNNNAYLNDQQRKCKIKGVFILERPIRHSLHRCRTCCHVWRSHIEVAPKILEGTTKMLIYYEQLKKLKNNGFMPS